MRIGLAAEGPTDFIIIEAALAAILGTDIRVDFLQPVLDEVGSGAGPFGGGWKGVRGWCQETAREAGSVATTALLSASAAVVIHVDADIASDSEINVWQPCPPASDTIASLRRGYSIGGTSPTRPGR